MKGKKKIITLALALALIVGIGAYGTYAWLTATSETKVNTFTVGNINITLAETTGDEYKMVPGKKLAKDPKVTVAENSEACYLFVKVTETNNTAHMDGETAVKFISYTMAGGWTELPANPGVYYRTVDATTTDPADYQVFAGEGEGDLAKGFVTVNGEVTKADMDGVGENKPELVITAYAVQQEGIATAADAWAKLS